MKNIFFSLAALFIIHSSAIAQLKKRAYLSPLNRYVESTVNSVSVVSTGTSESDMQFISVNAIRETARMENNIWLQRVNKNGSVIQSLSLGKRVVSEEALSIIHCPNGDVIIAASTADDLGNRSCWIFRRGIITWSYKFDLIRDRSLGPRRPGDTAVFTPGCIKKTNEAAENYIISVGHFERFTLAASFGYLYALKINAAGTLLWAKRYNGWPNGAIFGSNVYEPKSMLVNNDTVLIAGNYKSEYPHGHFRSKRIFVLGISQVTGDIVHNSSPVGIGETGAETAFGVATSDPFINAGYDNTYVLTCKTESAVDGVTAGRLAFLQLDYNLNVIGDAKLFWDTDASDMYGHSVYKINTTVQRYAIGGGGLYNATAVTAEVNNPVFLILSKTGVPDRSMCQRFWTGKNFHSTFMAEDVLSINMPFKHIIHSHANRGSDASFSLIRSITKPLMPPCNKVMVNLNVRTAAVGSFGADGGWLRYSQDYTGFIVRTSYTYSAAAFTPAIRDCE